MDTTTLIILWILIVGIVVALVAWFGPRPSQWRTHEGADEVRGESAADEEQHDENAGQIES